MKSNEFVMVIFLTSIEFPCSQGVYYTKYCLIRSTSIILKIFAVHVWLCASPGPLNMLEIFPTNFVLNIVTLMKSWVIVNPSCTIVDTSAFIIRSRIYLTLLILPQNGELGMSFEHRVIPKA